MSTAVINSTNVEQGNNFFDFPMRNIFSSVRAGRFFYAETPSFCVIKQEAAIMTKGYIHVYTGDGKGKTTAAIGLAIRAVGAGKKVCILQFMKSLAYSEQKILQSIPGITLITLGKPYFIAKEGMLTDEQRKTWGNHIRIYPAGHPPKDYREMTLKGIEQAIDAVSKNYDMVILDEYNMARWYDLATEEETEKILKARRPEVELIFTGRNAPKEILDAADLITEMKKIRHYYDKGVPVRTGIEN